MINKPNLENLCGKDTKLFANLRINSSKFGFILSKNALLRFIYTFFAPLCLYSVGEHPYVATKARRNVERELKPER